MVTLFIWGGGGFHGGDTFPPPVVHGHSNTSLEGSSTLNPWRDLVQRDASEGPICRQGEGWRTWRDTDFTIVASGHKRGKLRRGIKVRHTTNVTEEGHEGAK